MKNLIFTFILFIFTPTLFACSCPQIKIINVFSNFEFIGIVQFESLKEVKKKSNYFESKIKIKELFKGESIGKLYIHSDKGSSCEFMPEMNSDYFILGFKNDSGMIETSFCLTYEFPNNEKLSIFRELVKERGSDEITSNLIQYVKEDIDAKLFKKDVNGYFLYRVLLNSDLSIKEIIPVNNNAIINYDDKVRNDLKRKIFYRKADDKIKLGKTEFNSFLILNWSENQKNEKIITPTKL